MTDVWQVHRVTAAEAAAAAPLFAAYREFYGAPYDEPSALAWLHDRLSRDESVVLVARRGDDDPVGLCQLYRGFSSVGLRPAWILNDLYVAEAARGTGAAALLLTAAEDVAREAGCVALTLETRRTNLTAQRLYRRSGWLEEREYLRFTKAL